MPAPVTSSTSVNSPATNRLAEWQISRLPRTEPSLSSPALGPVAANVVCTDNHREIAHQVVGEPRQQSVTDEVLDNLLPQMPRSGDAPLSWLFDSENRLRDEFQSRVASFGRTLTEMGNLDPPGWEAVGGDPAACYRLACEGAEQTSAPGNSPVGGGGVVLYEKTARRGGNQLTFENGGHGGLSVIWTLTPVPYNQESQDAPTSVFCSARCHPSGNLAVSRGLFD